MAARATRWVMLGLTGLLVTPGIVSAQFTPYVMPRFNPIGPANPVGPAMSPSGFSTDYLGPYDQYSSYPYNSYGVGPVGGAFMGLADLQRAYGTNLLKIEQARIMREQSIQARFDTQR